MGQVIASRASKTSSTNYARVFLYGSLLLVLCLAPIDNYFEEGSAIAAGPALNSRNYPRSNLESTLGDLRSSQEITEVARNAGQIDGKGFGGEQRKLPQNQPRPNLERVNLDYDRSGRAQLPTLPKFESSYRGRIAAVSGRDDYVFYTLDPDLQQYTKQIVERARAPHVAVVTMNPRTGEILSIAEKSQAVRNLSLYSGIPAASIFKLVTTTAALERSPLGPLSAVRFRGGNYTLNQWNYKPNPRTDKRAMPLAEALGKSVNAVFARVALNHLSTDILSLYSRQFGFNSFLHTELPLRMSNASIPDGDYELSRTAAGFGEVSMSPVHAVTLMSGIANGGLLPRPLLIKEILHADGEIKYESSPETLARIMQRDTARKLMNMMEYTTTVGTSRHEFYSRGRRRTPYRVAAKTGTLSGDYPKGINHWFVAAAPLEDPQLAVAVLVVNPGSGGTKSSQIGRMLFERYVR